MTKATYQGFVGTGSGLPSMFWLQVVTELENPGVQDIFIACVDGHQSKIDYATARLKSRPEPVYYLVRRQDD